MPHPVIPGETLTFLADAPHVLKNIRGALCKGSPIIISKDIVERHGFSSNLVEKKHLQALVDFQENSALKIAPNLTSSSLSPAHFLKMSVKDAMRVISRSTSAGLRYLVNTHGHSQDLLTTAWFIDQTSLWFDLVTSRHPIEALSMKNMPKYVEAINSLKLTMEVFQTLTVQGSGWKPWQTGLIMNTKSILSMQERMLVHEDFYFFLTARTTQDCLENVFSQTRARSPIPSAREVKSNLRSVTIAQFLTEKKNSSYHFDDADFLIDFLKKPNTAPVPPEELENEQEDQEIEDNPNLIMNFVSSENRGLKKDEQDALYYIAGWVVKGVKENTKVCDSCFVNILSTEEDNSLCSLVIEKDYTGHSLLRVSELLFNILFKAEIRFQQARLDIPGVLKKLVKDHLDCFGDVSIPDCHGILKKILTKYFRFRLKTHGLSQMRKDREERLKAKKSGLERSSKSAAMRACADAMR